MDTLKIGVLGSTRGTDLEGVIKAIKEGRLQAEVVVVISDRKGAYILERARKYGIEAVYISPREFSSRENFDRKVSQLLREREVEIVLLIGYMRILSPSFVKEWKNRIMNIHPSLLPAFAGGMDLNVHEEVIKRGVKITGCTLHFVDEGADTGPIILQKAVEVDEEETPETLKAKVQRAEQEIIVEGLRLFSQGKLQVEDNKVRIV
ncbi:phosphoribosylglycinamide formyltransferase [Candidatus Calescamantes bacterium]|nr:phosphoribosylglycinamide formyltransferase [Candidatus Calescamantes bacterium]